MTINDQASASSSSSLSFEENLARLEATVRTLEDGQITLSESLQQYEQGVGYLKECYRLLEQAERRIELLTGFDAQGNPIVEPFDEAEMSLEEKAQVRSRRRSRSASRVTTEASVDDSGMYDSERLF
jgi:exodeoxyribonuclease VII small subunit